MIVLAMDTSTSACSAALWADGRILARRLSPMARGQSEALMPMVAEVMAEAGLDFKALDLLAVSVGPGAFTGLRIGLDMAHWEIRRRGGYAKVPAETQERLFRQYGRLGLDVLEEGLGHARNRTSLLLAAGFLAALIGGRGK